MEGCIKVPQTHISYGTMIGEILFVRLAARRVTHPQAVPQGHGLQFRRAWGSVERRIET